jgi:alpha-beta hydrolase superfamily lysophospholipase
MGATVAACLAGRRSEIKAVVLWAGSAHPERLARRLLDDPHSRRALEKHGFVDRAGNAVGRDLIDDAPGIHPLSEIAASTAPVLIVHGTNDQTVPVRDAADYLEAADQPDRTAELVTIDAADHTFAALPWETQLIAVTRDFLAQQLTP